MQYRDDLKNTVFHTAIIGGGASGLFCAGSFSTTISPKIVLEANEKPALKVGISGGGKCNFSNKNLSPVGYVSKNKHFCKSALAAFKPVDFLHELEKAGLAWEEKEDGKLFARNAQEIVRFLVKRAKEKNTRLALGVRALEIKKEKGFFVISTSAGPVRAQRVVLATGGLSYPALGANGFGFKIARQFDIPLIDQSPVLCGLLLPKTLREHFSSLAGNSLAQVRIVYNKQEENGPLLFAHDGFSGPVILQTSLYWQEGSPVQIDFLPGTNALQFFACHKNTKYSFSGALSSKNLLPARIAKTLLWDLDRDLANASRQEMHAAATRLNNFSFVPAGTFGYTKAEATRGGIQTQALIPSTCEVRSCPGLYVIGELIDVTGRVGGFNLHWAWASAWAAAKDLEKQF